MTQISHIMEMSLVYIYICWCNELKLQLKITIFKENPGGYIWSGADPRGTRWASVQGKNLKNPLALIKKNISISTPLF